MNDKRHMNLARPHFFLRRFINSYCHFPSLWNLIVSQRDFDSMLEEKYHGLRYVSQRLAQKLIWFWPRLIESRIWIEGVHDGHYKLESFDGIDVASQALCDAVTTFAEDFDAPILDLGCNRGRHLINLHGRGHKNLYGVDAMQIAIERFSQDAPEVSKDCAVECGLFQQYLPAQNDGAFEIVYSYGATIELVHPSFDVVREVCRVSKRFVILVQNEIQLHGYPRFWQREFARNGFHLRSCLRPIGDYPSVSHTDTDTSNEQSLLIFQRHET